MQSNFSIIRSIRIFRRTGRCMEGGRVSAAYACGMADEQVRGIEGFKSIEMPRRRKYRRRSSLVGNTRTIELVRLYGDCSGKPGGSLADIVPMTNPREARVPRVAGLSGQALGRPVRLSAGRPWNPAA